MSKTLNTGDRRKEVMGVLVDALSMCESIAFVSGLISAGRKGQQHVVVNAAKIVEAHRDHELQAIINNAHIINADGQAVVWAGRLLGVSIPERVAGIDFMTELMRVAPERKWRVFLLGATCSVVNSVKERYEAEGVNIVGALDGYWRQSRTDEELVAQIASTDPDLLFVALPSPMKERFLSRYLADLNVGLAVGVGGSFDVLAGKTKRAPVALQELGSVP